MGKQLYKKVIKVTQKKKFLKKKKKISSFKLQRGLHFFVVENEVRRALVASLEK